MNRKFAMAVATAALLVGMLPASAAAAVGGAGFTTFADASKCFDSPNGIDCNNYDTKIDVYMNGGPTAGGITAGSYYFTVVAPGSQASAPFDESDAGNLSACGNDVYANRTFDKLANGNITYTGADPTSHILDTIHGKTIISLGDPNNLYCDTPNPGGVYIMAICAQGATGPADCKYDAFRITGGEPVTPEGVLSGSKYYDANENGQRDPNEVGIAGWKITITDGTAYNLTTDANGDFSQSNVPADTYTVAEVQAGSPWVQTGNTVDQTSSSGGNFVQSLTNFVYTVVVADGTTSGLNFGNVCRLTPGGLTIGFWSNKNGLNLLTADDFAALNALHLRNANGTDRDFNEASLAQKKNAFRGWLLSATATNMAYMLSAQLAGTVLNVRHGFTNPSIIVDAAGHTVADIIALADAALAADGLTLAGDPNRADQETLKNILDKINNGGSFTQPTPDTCPTPVFPN